MCLRLYSVCSCFALVARRRPRAHTFVKPLYKSNGACSCTLLSRCCGRIHAWLDLRIRSTLPNLQILAFVSKLIGLNRFVLCPFARNFAYTIMDQLDLGNTFASRPGLPIAAQGTLLAAPGVCEQRRFRQKRLRSLINLTSALLQPSNHPPQEDGGGEDGLAPRKFARPSPDLAAHMRTAKQLKTQQWKIDTLQAKLDNSTATLELVTGLLPEVCSLVGRLKGATTIGKMQAKNLSPKHFLLLIRAAFMPSKSKVAIGIKLKRLICVLATLIQSPQTLSMGRALRCCHAARRGRIQF